MYKVFDLRIMRIYSDGMIIRVTAYEADGTRKWSKNKRDTEVAWTDLVEIISVQDIAKVTLTSQDGSYKTYERIEE